LKNKNALFMAIFNFVFNNTLVGKTKLKIATAFSRFDF
jgi:hypothetical protein